MIPFQLFFLQPVLASSHPVFCSQLAIPQGWLLNTGLTIMWKCLSQTWCTYYTILVFDPKITVIFVMTHILLPVINKIPLLENQPWDQGGVVF